MEPTIGAKPLAVRIISGSPAVIEGLINELGTEYSATTWNFAVVKDELTITVVLISASLIRQAQIAQGAAAANGRR